MTMHDNNNPRRVGIDRNGFGWGIPAAIAAVALIIGGLFYMNSDAARTTTTANSERPAATQTGPAGSQAPAQTPTTTPAPATAPKQ